nr:DUF3592 domain-containing protein [uncultured Butyrivibrio sp.]
MKSEGFFYGCILLIISLVFAYVLWQVWGGPSQISSTDDEDETQSGNQIVRILLPIVIGMFAISFILISGVYVYFNYVGAGIAAGGALFSYIGILFITSGNKKKKRCTASCLGYVSDHLEQEDSENRVSYVPIITYTVNGNKYTLQGDFGGGKKAIPQIGDTIEVFYDPMSPKVAQSVHDRKESKVFAIWFLAFGIPMFLIGLEICIPLERLYWIIRAWFLAKWR